MAEFLTSGRAARSQWRDRPGLAPGSSCHRADAGQHSPAFRAAAMMPPRVTARGSRWEAGAVAPLW